MGNPGPKAPKKTDGGTREDEFPGLDHLDRPELDEDVFEIEEEGLDYDDDASSISRIRRTSPWSASAETA
jgi:hypothetical protein